MDGERYEESKASDIDTYNEIFSDLGRLSTESTVALERKLLTWTEFHELELSSLGFSSFEAADMRGVTSESVRITLSTASRKLGALNTPHAVRIAIESLILPINVGDKPQEKLDNAEFELLHLVSSGYVNRQICQHLGISPKECSKVHGSIRDKLQVSSRPHLVRRGYEVGILLPKFKLEYG